MALFRRNQNQASIPEEIKEYYQAGKRQNAGIAWLLAIGTLIVTIVLAILLFFAGRWVWQQVFDNNDQQISTTQNENADEPVNQDSSSESGQGDNQDQEQNQESQNNGDEEVDPTQNGNNGETNQDRLPGDDTEGVVDPEAAVDDPTGGRDSTPETGPGDTLAIFVAATAIGYLLHRGYLLERE